MPLEIKELHIKINVEDTAGTSKPKTGGNWSAEQEEQLIAKCIKQVLRVLKDRNEP